MEKENNYPENRMSPKESLVKQFQDQIDGRTHKLMGLMSYKECLEAAGKETDMIMGEIDKKNDPEFTRELLKKYICDRIMHMIR